MTRHKRNSPTKPGPGYRKLHLIRHWPTWHPDYDKWRKTFTLSALARIKLRDEIYALQPARLKRITLADVPMVVIEKISDNPPTPGPA